MNAAKLFVVLAVAIGSSGFADKGIWIIDAESQLTIQGTTNVNAFTCKIDYCTGRDTLQYVESGAGQVLRFTRSRMTVPVRSFDCGARPISRDFWKTLRADEYPDMIINFISLENLNFKNNSYVDGIVDITLAGVTARYTISYFVSIKANGTVLLKGCKTVGFADFRLAAPQKLNGLIKVKESLNVDFNLLLNEV